MTKIAINWKDQVNNSLHAVEPQSVSYSTLSWLNQKYAGFLVLVKIVILSRRHVFAIGKINCTTLRFISGLVYQKNNSAP